MFVNSSVCCTQGPKRIAMLPNDEEIITIWAGSEFTIACDGTQRLWGCGWNEHANLGTGDSVNHYSWNPVLSESHNLFSEMTDDTGPATIISAHGFPDEPKGKHHHQLQLAYCWDGSVACGCGHCLAVGYHGGGEEDVHLS